MFVVLEPNQFLISVSSNAVTVLVENELNAAWYSATWTNMFTQCCISSKDQEVTNFTLYKLDFPSSFSFAFSLPKN